MTGSAVTAERATPLEAPAENWTEGRLCLPGGILGPDGSCLKQVVVRQLTGRDEELLSDRRYRNGAQQVTDFLAAAIERVEGLERPVDRDLAANLLIGDRDYLLLRLRQIAVGDVVEQVMHCPSRTCGEKVDVDFRIGEIAVRRLAGVEPFYELRLSRPALNDDEGSMRVRLRLPCGRDQEAIEELRDSNPGAANTRLFSRLVLEIGRRRGMDEETARSLPLGIRREIAAFLAATSPGPDLSIAVLCPFCGTDMTYPFDLQRFFFDEWRVALDQLYQEVHHLAFHYHWSEGEILGLPRVKRRRYLTLLAESFERSREQDAVYG